tara:strand:- start:65 stop:388 length:324 start_codon:yes stop_codon:yes gene_type:complete
MYRNNPQDLIILRPEGYTAIDFVEEAAQFGLEYLQDVESMASNQTYLRGCMAHAPGKFNDETDRWWSAVRFLSARRCYRMISEDWHAKQHAKAAAPKRYLFGSPVVP